jgi:hypothetical protein
MDVTGQLHAFAALPLKKGSLESTVQEAGWASEMVWTLWRREKSLTETWPVCL